MSIESLVKEIEASTSHDLERISKRVQEEFAAAKTSEERAQVLAIFKAMTDRVERGLEARGHDEVVAQLRTANAYVYKSLVAQECLDAWGNVSVEKLIAVTNREIAAGRMTEDHPMRKIAVEGCAPRVIQGELLARVKIKNLINEMHSAKDVVEVREKIEREWNAATTSYQRDALHAEPLAKHAESQPGPVPAPKTPASDASVSYAFGATLGKKLKGLFRK